jgi:N utilization substance protein B
VPPAVTINEAVTIIKKYSTAESGKFVNGVLGGVMKISPKADGKALVNDESQIEDIVAEPEIEPIVEEINENSPEMEELARVGAWTLRAEEIPS